MAESNESNLPLEIPWAERAIEGGTLIIIFIVAAIGNVSLWIVVLRSRDLRNESNYLVLCLSFADLLVSFVGMPITVFTIFNGAWSFPQTACTAIGFVNMVTFVGSVVSLGTISLNRYVKICLSHRYKVIYTRRNIVYMVSGVWVLSGLLSLPPLIGWGVYDYIPTQSFCFCDWPTSVSYTYFMVVACFGGPCSVMAFCYIKILKVFRASKNRIAASVQESATPVSKPEEKGDNLVKSSGANNVKINFLTVPEDKAAKTRSKLASLKSKKAARRRQEEFRLALSLLIVIFVFIVCWLPFCVTMFLSVYVPSSVRRGSDMFTILLGYGNSGCNPIIYGFMNNRFKAAYKKLWYDAVSPCVRPTVKPNINTTTTPSRSGSDVKEMSNINESSI